jgi:hypothetical protein
MLVAVMSFMALQVLLRTGVETGFAVTAAEIKFRAIVLACNIPVLNSHAAYRIGYIFHGLSITEIFLIICYT